MKGHVMKTVEVGYLSGTSVETVIQYLQEVIDHHGLKEPKFYHDEWEGSYWIKGYRPMTQEEKDAAAKRAERRKEAAEKRRQKIAAKEIAQLNRLREKYPDV